MVARAAPPRQRRPLAEVAAEVARGEAGAEELHQTFLAATVWCEAGERPGFVAIGAAGDGLIPVFTSPEQLARARGAVAWFSTTGADVLGLVPEGYDIALDMAGDAPLRLRMGALRTVLRPVVGWG
ncbi:MAG: SseB family protein [Actinomycetota bacterium]|nr:SseB family protein [Actinomycetota bacterium]